MDRLNAKYGTDVHFASKTEKNNYNIDEELKNVSLADFEKDIEEAILENERAKQEAKKAKKKSEELDDSKNIYLVSGRASSSTVTREKDVSGATVHMTADVSNSSGYWHYTSIGTIWTSYLAGVNSTPAFYSLTYNYDLIDSNRTCAISLYGVTIGNYGVIIDSNAYRYVEFWAGNGM